MTTDERIDQLLQELDYIVMSDNNPDTIEELRAAAVKKFMQDMGSSIVAVQAVDEFAEYLKEYVDVGDGKMYVITKQFKKEKGYDN